MGLLHLLNGELILQFIAWLTEDRGLALASVAQAAFALEKGVRWRAARPRAPAAAAPRAPAVASAARQSSRLRDRPAPDAPAAPPALPPTQVP
jgi:hypothetical protein